MLLNTVESKDIDHRVEAAVNAFLTRQNSSADPTEFARKISWSVKVKLEQ